MKKLTIASVSLLMLSMSACCGGSKCDSNAKCDKECEGAKECGKAIACSDEELAGIEKALGYYTEAAVKGDSKIAKQGFALLATMSYAENDSLITVPIQALYDYYDQTGPHNASYEIADCSVAGNVAMVRIESKFGENEFSDMFTLVKDGADWKIVSKVYHNK
ncbi:MAG: nuclear transport factor 2 family protein [Muribaculaceae bacterium]|nr:nuclear transport factor 2 family protein [Muribaculaceae bacterium]